IVADEMKHSVQGQYLDFLRGRMTQAQGILFRDVRRNRNIAGQPVFKLRCRWKREYVGRLILPPEAPVERSQFGAAGDQHIDRARKLAGTAGPRHKLCQSSVAQSRHGLAEYHQVFFASFAEFFAVLAIKAFPAGTEKQTGGPRPGALLFDFTRSTRWFLLPKRARRPFRGTPSHCLYRSSLAPAAATVPRPWPCAHRRHE